MRHTTSFFCRVGGLAAGWAAGAVLAMAANLGTAAADPVLTLDPDVAVSIDGMTLFQDGTATATSSFGDIAIALGAGSDAIATGGVFESALANGTNALADALGSLSSATAVGTLSSAIGGGGILDSATAIGNGDHATAFGSADTASVLGNDSSAFALAGSNNVATVLGNNSVSTANIGNNDTASVIDTGSVADQAFAGGNNLAPSSNDLAFVLGMDSTALAGANPAVLDPVVGDFDLAAVFGDTLSAMAVNGGGLVDILPL